MSFTQATINRILELCDSDDLTDLQWVTRVQPEDKVLSFDIKSAFPSYMIGAATGFLPNGGYIQKNYDYGCMPPKEGESYTHEKHFKVRIYRVTITNVDGVVHEFSAREVQQWCAKVGLIPVEEFYYGYAKNLYPDLAPSDHWNENFMEKLANDTQFYMERNSPSCDNKVPHEGIVIKIENMKSEAFKLKCFNFLNMSQKDESTDIEIE